jgi:hypothetical protein
MALITSTTNLDYLITPVRLQINDFDLPYTYSDDLLRTRLVYGVKALMSRWNNKYLINNDTNNIERNPNVPYLFPDPPLVQAMDERPIILQAAIGVESALISSLSASAVTWKDDEVSYSNKDSIAFQQAALLRDLAELEALLPVAGKRLAQAKRGDLPGFSLPYDRYEG